MVFEAKIGNASTQSEVNFVKRYAQTKTNNNNNGTETRGNKNNKQRKKTKCNHCGWKTHASDKCKYKDSTCDVCKVKGHLATVCKKKVNLVSTKQFNNYLNHTDDVNANFSEFSILCVDSKRVSAPPPYTVTVYINQAAFKFILDCGSSGSLISKNLFTRHFDGEIL